MIVSLLRWTWPYSFDWNKWACYCFKNSSGLCFAYWWIVSYDIRVCNYLIIFNTSLQFKQRRICNGRKMYAQKWKMRHNARKFTYVNSRTAQTVSPYTAWMCSLHQVAVHAHRSKTIWDRFVLADTPSIVRVVFYYYWAILICLTVLYFCFHGFPCVIAPAFSTPAFSFPCETTSVFSTFAFTTPTF